MSPLAVKALQFAIMIASLKGLSYVDQKNFRLILGLRIFYGFSMLAVLGLYLYIYLRLSKQKTEGTVEVEERVIPVQVYDKEVLTRSVSETVIQGGMIIFLHTRSGTLYPLLAQGVSRLISAFTSPLFKVYILSQTLPRPFVSDQEAIVSMIKNMIDKRSEEEKETKEVKDSKETKDAKETKADKASAKADKEDSETIAEIEEPEVKVKRRSNKAGK